MSSKEETTMTFKEYLGLEDNDKKVIYVTDDDGVYICDSSLEVKDWLSAQLCEWEIKDNVMLIHNWGIASVCAFNLDEYDVYRAESANVIRLAVPFEFVKVETDEELHS